MTAFALATTATSLTLAGLAAGGLAYAALHPRSQFFGTVLVAGPDTNQLALTFDDGPNPAATPQLLEVLARANVQATFFVVGKYVRQHPALTREIHAAGHLIGNHTMTHPWLAWQSRARIRRELTDCSKTIEDAIGVPVRLFRPPHGARRPYVLRVAKELGMTTVQWNIIPKDWQPLDAATILLRVERGVGRNRHRGQASNILLHDGDGSAPDADRLSTVEATRRLLELCKSSRRQFVTPEAWIT